MSEIVSVSKTDVERSFLVEFSYVIYDQFLRLWDKKGIYGAGTSKFLCVSVLNIPIQTHSECL